MTRGGERGKNLAALLNKSLQKPGGAFFPEKERRGRGKRGKGGCSRSLPAEEKRREINPPFGDGRKKRGGRGEGSICLSL